ncbi:COP9 signalosome complex subunit 6, partial [Coemansia sp. RSA 2399]
MLARDSAVAVLHPLVLLNISEHATRMAALVRCRKDANNTSISATQAALPPLVLGALLGNQADGGRHEVFLSFELKVEKENGNLDIDSAHFETRLEQLRVIFPNHEFIGWYVASSSHQVSPLMLELHTKLVSINPSALLLVFDASLAGE